MDIHELHKKCTSLEQEVEDTQNTLGEKNTELLSLQDSLKEKLETELETREQILIKAEQILIKAKQSFDDGNLETTYNLLYRSTPRITVSEDKPYVFTLTEGTKPFIEVANKIYEGTSAHIPLERLTMGQEIPLHGLQIAGLVTVQYDNSEFRIFGLPITPEQSEILLKEGKLPLDPSKSWQDLALALYDIDKDKTNFEEAKALYESIRENSEVLGLSNLPEDSVDEPLVIVHAGVRVQKEVKRYGVSPVVLSRLTDVYYHPILKLKGEHSFKYGTEKGFPPIAELDQEGNSRWIALPISGDRNLCWVYRCRSYWLCAWGDNLDGWSGAARVIFNPQGAKNFPE